MNMLVHDRNLNETLDSKVFSAILVFELFCTILYGENQCTYFNRVEVLRVSWGKGTHAPFCLQVSGSLP